jgi:hypothetical protein
LIITVSVGGPIDKIKYLLKTNFCKYFSVPANENICQNTASCEEIAKESSVITGLRSNITIELFIYIYLFGILTTLRDLCKKFLQSQSE